MSFALTGAVVSAIVEFTKGFLNTQQKRTAYVVGMSVLGGLGVYFFHLIPTDVVTTIFGIWAAANTVYIAVTQYLGPTQPVTPVVPPPAA